MRKNDCLAMLLAGGQGSRLEALTKHIAKPAVSFGGKYRIIDFALSNCANSGIDTVGVLTQYRPLVLNSYIGTGAYWDLDVTGGGVSILPPYATEAGGEWYKGTADAVFQNLDYINMNNPNYVLILSGDQLYRMDYRDMLKTHLDNNADLTVSVMEVPLEEASRFGIMTVDEEDKIVKFTEKPKNPDSTLASMGIYIFSKDVLERALREDNANPESSHDFGKDVIPKLLAEGKRLFCHRFEGYWRDVGTVASYYDTSMELLEEEPEFNLYEPGAPIMSNADFRPPHFVGENGSIEKCLVGNGSVVLGQVKHSILSVDSYIGEGAEVIDSILLPGAKVEAGAKIYRTIMSENACVKAGVKLGDEKDTKAIILIGDNEIVERG